VKHDFLAVGIFTGGVLEQAFLLRKEKEEQKWHQPFMWHGLEVFTALAFCLYYRGVL
jgi:hypothetical protein